MPPPSFLTALSVICAFRLNFMGVISRLWHVTCFCFLRLPAGELVILAQPGLGTRLCVGAGLGVSYALVGQGAAAGDGDAYAVLDRIAVGRERTQFGA